MTAATDVRYLDTPRVNTRSLLRNVYLWMTLALAITALSSYVTISTGVINALGNPFILWGALILQLALVVVLSVRLFQLSSTAAVVIFLVYAAATGFTLSSIFLYYDIAALTSAFVSTAALFGVMSFVGVFTKADLSKWGTYLFIGLIGVFAALLLNIFIRSSTLDLVISILGVILFTALTAYDTQKIARMSQDPRIQAAESSLMTKLSIMGALKLYLDFLNLFLFLLRIFGRNS